MILSLLPWKGKAIECPKPLVCVKMESQVCREQDMVHLGDDECVECGCPDGGEEKNRNGEVYCCKDYKLFQNNLGEYLGQFPSICGCPEGGEPRGYLCCKNNKAWDSKKHKYEEVFPASLRYCGCPEEYKKQLDGKELCCTNEIPERSPVCPPEKGVPFSVDGICGCGCETDDDCNTDREWYQFLKDRRKCALPDHKCIKKLSCHQFDNLTIELEEREGDELKPERLPALAAKLKSKMGLDVDEHVKLVIESRMCGYSMGFSPANDPTTIYVNINHCCEISEGEWTCEGTVLHENEHRQDNYKQPVWYKNLKSTIAKAFADNLTEINAHAKGDIKDMTQRYKICYPVSNNFQNVCKVNSQSDQCKKCAKQYVPAYLKDFDNPEYAKKYHDDPDYFDPDGGCKGQSYNTCPCRGIRLEWERKYINSEFAKEVYIAGQAVRNATKCGDSREDATKEDLRKVIEALAECKGWEKPPREDLTDLPKLMAQLYKEKNELCMSAEEIAQNANIAKGLEGLETCSIIHDFLQVNANADLNNLPTTCEEKCEKVTLTSE